MLIKIKNDYVDPSKVLSIRYEHAAKMIKIDVLGAFTNIWIEGSEEDVDTFAAIINNAVGQSYGGQEDEEAAGST